MRAQGAQNACIYIRTQCTRGKNVRNGPRHPGQTNTTAGPPGVLDLSRSKAETGVLSPQGGQQQPATIPIQNADQIDRCFYKMALFGGKKLNCHSPSAVSFHHFAQHAQEESRAAQADQGQRLRTNLSERLRPPRFSFRMRLLSEFFREHRSRGSGYIGSVKTRVSSGSSRSDLRTSFAEATCSR